MGVASWTSLVCYLDEVCDCLPFVGVGGTTRWFWRCVVLSLARKVPNKTGRNKVEELQ
jgi:hypothetical protein